ncbi:ABC transporter substrate-binding protein [Pseudonocardia kunmingensis]|uniref:ABC transporter substrate-binding protein n=1 Tax=Pseudonocardia kunmingensis TaxID=630975 RepID=UPI0014797BB3|nr:ABC transporter substrate-binding protein [Pseudonocardia kunmingensis]
MAGAAVALVLAGCGDGGGTGGGAEPLQVGALFAMTGEGSFYGDVMSKGSQVAVDQVNAGGGAEGHTFELQVEDHRSGNVDAAVSAARKLLNVDGATVLLSSFTAPTVAVQPMAVDQGVLLLNGGGVGDDLVGVANLYNNRMLGKQLLPSLVSWTAQQSGAQRVATIFWNDAAGTSDNEAVKEGCRTAGCQVVAEEPHEVGATDYATQLARIRSADPDLLVIGSYGNDVGYIIQQARRLGMMVPIIGNEWTPDAAAVAGAAMEGYVAIIDRFDPAASDPEGAAFAQEYQQRFGVAPEFYAANYYDLLRFVLPDLIAMATRAGQDPTQPGVLADQMAAAVAQGHEFGTVYGETMTFNPDGTVEKPAAVFAADGAGRITPIASFDDGRIVPAGG